jgi:hypothetical protein
MRLSWPEHLQAARTLELSGDSQRGEALALMGMALLVLAQDLLDQELAEQALQQGSNSPNRPSEPF